VPPSQNFKGRQLAAQGGIGTGMEKFRETIRKAVAAEDKPQAKKSPRSAR
jgi:hypothetical protein